METYSSKGDLILKSLDSTKNFTDWMYLVMSQWLHGDILEIGSGVGTYSQKVVKDHRFINSSITFSDIDKRYVNLLKAKYKGFPNINACKLDIASRSEISLLKKKFDSVFALNVLEHIEDDVDTLNNIYNLLRKDGILVLILPNYKFLFNTLDKTVNHYRRYNKADILRKLNSSKYELVELSYFNSIGVLGWFINGNILKKDEIDASAGFLLKVYDRMIPLWRHFEKVLFSRFLGLSLLVVLKKR